MMDWNWKCKTYEFTSLSCLKNSIVALRLNLLSVISCQLSGRYADWTNDFDVVSYLAVWYADWIKDFDNYGCKS